MSDKRIIISDPITQDRLFPVTLADSVYYADGTPLQHTHDLSSMNGVLPISKGGTGVTTLDELRKLIGSGSSANTAPGGTTDYTGIIDGMIALGGTVTMADIDWTVVHVDKAGGVFYMCKTYVEEIIKFGPIKGGNSDIIEYYGSAAAKKCQSFYETLPKNVQDMLITVETRGVIQKVFLPRIYQICTGGSEGSGSISDSSKGIFDYFIDIETRIAYDASGTRRGWWTSSNGSKGCVIYFDENGSSHGSNYQSNLTLGFRPFVALKL